MARQCGKTYNQVCEMLMQLASMPENSRVVYLVHNRGMIHYVRKMILKILDKGITLPEIVGHDHIRLNSSSIYIVCLRERAQQLTRGIPDNHRMTFIDHSWHELGGR